MDEMTADDASLLGMLMALISAETWKQARNIVDDHPALLTDRALVLLDLVADQIGTSEDDDDDIVQAIRVFLRRCREVGTLAAYEEQVGDVQLPDWLRPLSNLIMATEDLDVEMQAYQDILSNPRFPQLVPELRAQVLGRASSALLRRSEADSRLDHIDQALRQLDKSMTLVSDETPVGGELLNHLLYGRIVRYEHTGASQDLEAALDVLKRQDRREGLELQDRCHYLAMLGGALLNRYERKGLVASLNGALRTLQEATDSSAADDPDLAGRLDQLGAAWMRRYELDGSTDQIDSSIVCLSRAVALTPTSSPDRSGPLSNLGNALLTRYEENGDRADLDGAISAFEQSLAVPQQDADGRAMLLSNYSNALWRRYEQTGRLEDQDASIDVLQQAAGESSAEPRVLASVKSNLGANLRHRYERLGRLDDLNAAIATLREAVALYADSPAAQHALNNLGAAMLRRHESTQSLADLTDAIAVFRHAIELASSGSPELPTYLANLGTALRQSIAVHDQSNNMDEMVAVLERAVHLTPGNSPDLARRLTGLGSALLLRHEVDAKLSDLDQATDVLGRAAALTRADSPDLPRRLMVHGMAMVRQTTTARRRTRTGTRRPLITLAAEHVAATFRRACEFGLDVDVYTARESAVMWGDWAQGRQAWQEAAEAYGFGMVAMRSLVRVQLMRTEKEASLRQSSYLPPAAAFACASSGALMEAVVALEQGRAALLDEALQRDRANLEGLRDGQWRSLVDRYERAAADERNLQARVIASTFD